MGREKEKIVRSWTRRAVSAAVVLATLAVPATGSADKLDDLRRERDRVQAERAAAAANVDATQGEVDQLTTALAELNTLVDEQNAEVLSATQAVALADQALAETEAGIVTAEAELAATRTNLRRLAVDSYMGQDSGEEGDLALFTSDELSTGVRARAYLDFGSGNLGDQLDELRALETDLNDLRDQREDQLSSAQAARDEEQTQLDQLNETLGLQQQLVGQAEDRLDHMLGEIASLETIDSQLAQQIKDEQARITAELERKRKEREAAQRQSQSGSATRTRPPIVPQANMVSVNGIQVHTSIADETRALLDAAADDGVVLGGSGWRSSETQIELRKAHCGASDYAIWQAPPNACSPPTARPGESMHERGMAIDFTYNGRAISSRSSPAFQWLAANAGRFGFENLPSEPWHWSVDGT